MWVSSPLLDYYLHEGRGMILQLVHSLVLSVWNTLAHRRVSVFIFVEFRT